MSKPIDPIERALDAYYGLTDSDRLKFAEAVNRISRYVGGVRYIGTTEEPAPTPKRGRPKGSKNRKFNPLPGREAMADGEAIDLRETNAATREGL